MTSETGDSFSQPASTTTTSVAPQRRFRAIAISPFEPALIAAELLKPSVKQLGRNDVLLAGLAAWIIAPKDKAIRNESMQNRARELYLRQCEKIALAGLPETPGSKPWPQRQLCTFCQSIYIPLGGQSVMRGNRKFSFLSKIMDPRSMMELQSHGAKASRSFEHVHRLMGVWHYLAEADSGNAGVLKVESGARAVSRIGICDDDTVRLSSRTVERSWERVRPAVAFSYSALQIELPDRDTIFAKIIKQQLTFSTVKPQLNKWFSYAKYVNEKILLNLAPAKRSDRFPDLTPLDVPLEPFSSSHLSAREIRKIQEEI